MIDKQNGKKKELAESLVYTWVVCCYIIFDQLVYYSLLLVFSLLLQSMHVFGCETVGKDLIKNWNTVQFNFLGFRIPALVTVCIHPFMIHFLTGGIKKEARG